MYSIEKSDIEFKNEPYLFEATMQSSDLTFSMVFECLITRSSGTAGLTFVTSPRFISENEEVNREFSNINKAFEYLKNVCMTTSPVLIP